MMFLCELVNAKNNVVHERFYKEGESAQAVKSMLELFHWKNEKQSFWRIEAQ